MASHRIDIAKYLAKLECAGMHQPLNAIQACASELATEIRSSLMSKENVAIINGQAPILEPDSCECYMWAVAILASAWSEWVFTAKSNDPNYQNNSTKHEAATNVKLALPYVKPSIEAAMLMAKEIGDRNDSNYRPENISVEFEITK